MDSTVFTCFLFFMRPIFLSVAHLHAVLKVFPRTHCWDRRVNLLPGLAFFPGWQCGKSTFMWQCNWQFWCWYGISSQQYHELTTMQFMHSSCFSAPPPGNFVFVMHIQTPRGFSRLSDFFFFSSLTRISLHLFLLFSHIMPKLTAKQTKKDSSAEMRAFGPLFNKDLGQHILKNPLVAQGIVDKVRSSPPHTHTLNNERTLHWPICVGQSEL